MTIAEIISLLRSQTYASWATDAKLLSYINIAYHDIENSIIRYVKEDFFWNKYTTDTVANQNEYVLKSPTSTVIWMKKVKRVEMKFTDTDTFRTVVSADTLSNYSNSEDWLQTYQDKSNPIYTVSDNSIFIYPTPTNSINDGLVIWTLNSQVDLTTAGVETDIFPWNQQLRDFHHLLALWAKQYVYQARGQINEKNDARNEYEAEKQKMISYLQGRIEWVVEWKLPDLSFYTS